MLARARLFLFLLALGAGTGAAAAAAPPGDAVYRTLCRSIQARHVRALFVRPVAPIELGGTSDCAFHPRGGNALVDGVRVFLRIDDGDRTLWLHRHDRSYGTFRRITGAGSAAKWGYESGRVPSVVDARTGTFTCTVMPASGGTAFAREPGTPLVAARTFASRLVALCADVFAAHR